MFKAIFRYTRAVGYLLTGRINSAREALEVNPHVVASTYDQIVAEKKQRVNQFHDALSELVAQQERDKHRAKQTENKIEELTRLKQGAIAKAKQIAVQYNNDQSAAFADPMFAKCMQAHKDFSSQLTERTQQFAEIEDSIEQRQVKVDNYKTQLEGLMREVKKVAEEKSEAVADVISAQQEEQIAKMMSGIAEDKTGEQLQRMRDLRHKATAKASVASEMAGIDDARSEAAFIEALEVSDAQGEFSEAIFGPAEKPKQVDSQQPETINFYKTAEKVQLPES